MIRFLVALFGLGGTPAKKPRSTPNPDRVRRLKGDKSFEIKVAGTSKFQREIEKVDKGIRNNATGDFLVMLCPEPENPHDASAVRVLKNDACLGYIPRDLAPQILQAMKDAGLVPLHGQAMAAIVGHGQGTLGVRLDIALPVRVA
jgi:F420-dependent methylenetetrahydromethanopterin dehydrogenase